MKRIKNLHPVAKTHVSEPQWVDIAVPFTYTCNSIHRHSTTGDPHWGRGGQVNGIAGGSEQFSAGWSGLVKEPLDCTVSVDDICEI